ncbi:MAG TPA: thioredoxin domain-containing protein [Gemmatimonadales bacterium]|jgi:protein-disulfide isomerase|nr:thioredoxin domain-containing protein [Gemmatimonadales bacterium]
MSPQLVTPVNDADHVAGSADAPITLVEYGDFECSHCGRAHLILQRLQEQLGADLRLVFRNFPVRESHPHAQHAAEAAESASERGEFWAMHDRLFEHQDALEDEDLLDYAAAIGLDRDAVAEDLDAGTFASKVRDEFMDGIRSGVNGTPTFFVNGQRYDGEWDDLGAFERALREAAGRSRSEA